MRPDARTGTDKAQLTRQKPEPDPATRLVGHHSGWDVPFSITGAPATAARPGASERPAPTSPAAPGAPWTRRVSAGPVNGLAPFATAQVSARLPSGAGRAGDATKAPCTVVGPK